VNSKYDEAGDFYFDFVTVGLSDAQSMMHLSVQSVLRLSENVKGKFICDLACGEGHLSRIFADHGATVTAVDYSQNLLEHAFQKNESRAIKYVHDDAQTLVKLDASQFDLVVCNIALMDIPDLIAVYRSVNRVLKPGGRFVLSVLHPCFETPFQVPESHLQFDSDGNFEGFIVRRYANEGFWNSGGTGMRGKFGAYHRTLSTYLNELMQASFTIIRLDEPRLPPGAYENASHQLNSRVGQLLVIAAQKITGTLPSKPTEPLAASRLRS
jgi:2-polyprenyl-3-methyl-5-hydroxy-6-metoxy-1,4-benzoquinol methylase